MHSSSQSFASSHLRLTTLFTMTLSQLASPPVVILILTITILVYLVQKCNRLPLPPGPPGIPLFGSALMADGRDYEVFAEWGRKYGTRLLARMFGR